jgi:hypothetical protein
MRARFSKRSLRQPAQGFALLLIVVALIAIGGIMLFSSLGGGAGKAERAMALQSNADNVLGNSRDALVGILLGPNGTGARPGQMPLPDSLENSKYDGVSDSHCLDGSKPNGMPVQTSSGANYRCLGRLPWKAIGLPSGASDEFDVLGVIPWYAVSANLADPNTSCLAALNPAILSLTYNTFVCGNPSQLPYPWLKVCDGSGRILSDRVAFVIIYPGESLATNGRTQIRNRSPRPNPADYLDAVDTPPGWITLPANQRCSAYDNAGLTNEFVKAQPTASFNDRLVYVTIDELMLELSKRVAMQVREALITFRDVKVSPPLTTFNALPWLSPLGNPDAATATVAVPSTKSGFFPYHELGTNFVTGFGWDIEKKYDFASGVSIWTPVTWGCTGQHLGVPFATICRIPTNTIDITVMNGFAQSQTLGETGACTWGSGSTLNSRLRSVNCRYTAAPATNLISLPYQIRSFSGVWTLAGNITGTRVRSAQIQILSTQGNWTIVPATLTSMLTRTVATTSSAVMTDNVIVEDRFSGTAPEGSVSNVLVGGDRTLGNGVVVVSGIRVYPEMPGWYASEQWYKYIYVALAPGVSPDLPGKACAPACFTSGLRSDIDAVVIEMGNPIAVLAQNRSTLLPPIENNFLELKNKTAMNGPTNQNVFEESNTPKSLNYDDVIVTIPR